MLVVDERGSAPAHVIMLHGCPTAPASMWRVGAALTDVATVHNVHLPGYAGSRAVEPFDEDVVLDQIEAWFAERGVEEAIYVGFSFGAYRAFALALRGKVRARGVVTLAGLHMMPTALREGLRGSAAAARDWDNDLVAMFTPRVLSPASLRNEAFRAEVASWFLAASRADMAAELEGMSHLPDLDLSRLDVPVLARVGDLDQTVPAALTDSICASAPRAERQLVARVAHAIMIEDEAATRAAVRGFVTRVLSAEGG